MIWSKFDPERTICALATPPGIGGLAVIRISGANSLCLTRKACSFLPKNVESHRVYVGYVKRPSGELIDQVVLTYFAEGKSFTGDETVELSCHGSPAVVSEILELLLSLGCSMASPGEFTFRAFSNGRMDLTQVEGLLDLLHSDSKVGARLAVRQLNGLIKSTVSEVESEIVYLLAHLEAGIDFSQEDLETISKGDLDYRLDKLDLRLSELKSSYAIGRFAREGLRAGIFGIPNVGKSSLLNLLLGESRAIVSAVPGTTRDYIEGELEVAGFRVRIIDTAGIRETRDALEGDGIARSLTVLGDVDIGFAVLDATRLEISAKELFLTLKERALPPTLYLLVNKVDLVSDADRATLITRVENLMREWVEWKPSEILCVSALAQESKAVLHSLLKGLLVRTAESGSGMISQLRQKECVERALVSVREARVALARDEGDEVVALCLREALESVLSVMGKRIDEEVLDRIFKEFCLGK